MIRQNFVLQLFCVFVFQPVFCILYTCRRGWGGLAPDYVEKKVGDSQLVTSVRLRRWEGDFAPLVQSWKSDFPKIFRSQWVSE